MSGPSRAHRLLAVALGGAALLAVTVAAVAKWLHEPPPANPPPPTKREQPVEPTLASTPTSPPDDEAPSGCSTASFAEFHRMVQERYPDCDTLPPASALSSLSCDRAEMALLTSGCIPKEHMGPVLLSQRIYEAKPSHPNPCENPDQGLVHVGFLSGRARCLATAESCAKTPGCEKWGRCGVEAGRCAATESRHCRESESCELAGRCTAHNSGCVTSCSDPEALQRASSEYLGKDAPLEQCVRTEASSCEETRGCQQLGYCEGSDGSNLCMLTCRTTDACQKEGLCHRGISACRARRDDGCRRSEACEKEGRCWAREGRCVSERELPECGEDERWLDGACRLPADFDCASSRFCDEQNKCRSWVTTSMTDGATTSEPYVVCIESEAFCAGSAGCEEQGLCSAAEETWVSANKCMGVPFEPCGWMTFGGCVKSEDGCRDSDACRIRGGCSADSHSSFCRPTRREHCEQSLECKTLGHCGLWSESSYNICGPRTDEHCRQSDLCREHGHCHYRDGACLPAQAP